LTGANPFYSYFQFGQSLSTTASYASRRLQHAVSTDVPISSVASRDAAVTVFVRKYGQQLSLAGSPQAQAGTTSIFYTSTSYFSNNLAWVVQARQCPAKQSNKYDLLEFSTYIPHGK
jgi:hypothetical protein